MRNPEQYDSSEQQSKTKSVDIVHTYYLPSQIRQ